MSLSEVDPFLWSMMALCAIMAIVSALRYKSRGVSAYIMGSAFVAVGLGLLLIKIRAPIGLLFACGVVIVLLLGADFAARSAHRTNGGGR